MKKASLTIVFLCLIFACTRSYYHDAEVLSAYQRQARALCLNANVKTKITTCRRAKTYADAAQAGLFALLAYQDSVAKMTAAADDRLAADAAYASTVATCGIAGIEVSGKTIPDMDHNTTLRNDGAMHD